MSHVFADVSTCKMKLGCIVDACRLRLFLFIIISYLRGPFYDSVLLAHEYLAVCLTLIVGYASVLGCMSTVSIRYLAPMMVHFKPKLTLLVLHFLS
jgi:hypothetical protein